MKKPYVYVTRKVPEETLVELQETVEVGMWPEEEKPVPRDILLREAEKADGLVTMLTEKVDRELLKCAGRLKIIANVAVGHDNVDVEAASERGVTVTNTPDVLTDTTADLAFALMLAAARRLVEAAGYVKDDKWTVWSPMQMAGLDVHHKTLGIVGMGRIGQAVAKRAKGFDMEVLYHNRSRKPEVEQELGAIYSEFDKLLEKADFVVCLTPLTEKTRDMFNAKAFRKMKKSAVFVNAARGGVVDEKALEAALQNGEIAATGLDVFKNEPISGDHPLLRLENVVALPHIGSASGETRRAMIELACRNAALVLQGQQPKTPVNG